MEIPGLPPQLLPLLRQAAAHHRLALVGGAVRDLLLHRVHHDPWRGLPDLDLVVEEASLDNVSQPDQDSGEEPQPPAAHRLARRLRQQLGPRLVPYLQEHGAYGTVELELDLGAFHGAALQAVDQPLLLDLASARRESYPVPGENPRVRYGSLDDDLARRDFTINAMALLLVPCRGDPACPPDVSCLLDPHGGQRDLALRQLRFLHAASVRDDPTRVLRGARYVARLGFTLAPESLQQLQSTLATWPWGWRPGDPPGQAPSALGTRLRMELELLLEREAWSRALAALQGWGALLLFDARIQADRTWPRRLAWAQRFGLPLPAALVAGAADPLALAERLQLPHRQHKLLSQWLLLRQRLADAAASLADGPAAASQWTQLLESPGLSAEAVALALACGSTQRRPLLCWWLRWRHVRSPLSAEDLLAQGVRPGPQLGMRLRQARLEAIDQLEQARVQRRLAAPTGR
ncbi:CCA tRNA nucleotidyltransferase [Synechococcus sp. CS-1328]|uniref:CCA tRNA nucleotidyltransferase n=1 Tax=Synechococcus sp. CS-1328 TaxID=2847976 RepID=UPI00223A717B|nr:CCA tRNA nucleotidyltransferase [Synechococcus sp. CS-1328]MCT0223923.1 CCA tRNA nucleotidyltransferase [Synechococcus sp. CS-1328]